MDVFRALKATNDRKALPPNKENSIQVWVFAEEPIFSGAVNITPANGDRF